MWTESKPRWSSSSRTSPTCAPKSCGGNPGLMSWPRRVAPDGREPLGQGLCNRAPARRRHGDPVEQQQRRSGPVDRVENHVNRSHSALHPADADRRPPSDDRRPSPARTMDPPKAQSTPRSRQASLFLPRTSAHTETQLRPMRPCDDSDRNFAAPLRSWRLCGTIVLSSVDRSYHPSTPSRGSKSNVLRSKNRRREPKN